MAQVTPPSATPSASILASRDNVRGYNTTQASSNTIPLIIPAVFAISSVVGGGTIGVRDSWCIC